MSAYLIAQTDIKDEELFDRYREQSRPFLLKCGGRYLIDGQSVLTVEGEWDPGRLVIAEFDKMSDLRSFYDSTEYEPMKKMRQHAADSTIGY